MLDIYALDCISLQGYLSSVWPYTKRTRVKEEIDADMQRRFEYAERLRLEAGESPLAKRLRAQGLIK